jgi:beta-lactamase class A
MLLGLAFMLVAAACGGSGVTTTSVGPDRAAPQPAPSTTTDSTAPPPPGTVAPRIDGTQAAFDLVMRWLAGDELSEGDYSLLFGPEFIAQVSHRDLIGIFGQIGAAGEWTVVSTELETATELVRTIEAGTDRLSVQLAVADGRIVSLLFAPAVAFDQPANVSEALERLQSMGTVRLVVADRSGGSCAPVFSLDGEVSMPIGSIFKLYVLEALDIAAAGLLAWDDPVEIRDSLDSLPSGTTQDVPAGTELSVFDLASQMIAISDNTATDHLIDLVGRPAVEAAVASSGHGDPSSTFPFLTTREMFLLKLTASADLRAAYAAADVATRRGVLDGDLQLLDLPSLDDTAVQAWDEPIDIATIEWFASPMDICRVLSGLVEVDESREILAMNPGLPDGAAMWSYIGFKGGSEPGVLAASWYVETSDGGSFVVAGGVFNPDSAIDESEAIQLFGYIRDHIGQLDG